jgi:hypothetical protein
VNVPIPTKIYRIMHVDNLTVCLQRGALHAPRHVPDDGLMYRTIHNVDIQRRRNERHIPCGPRGVIHDYISFYFGPRSPMLYQLHTGWVPAYTDGQAPIVYLVSTAQAVAANGAAFVFSDGHGIAALTRWFDDLRQLDQVDWVAVYATIWRDTVDDMDRQRRKQAEFLVHRRCDWALIEEIGVLDRAVKARVEAILVGCDGSLHRPVRVHPDWYY